MPSVWFDLQTLKGGMLLAVCLVLRALRLCSEGRSVALRESSQASSLLPLSIHYSSPSDFSFMTSCFTVGSATNRRVRKSKELLYQFHTKKSAVSIVYADILYRSVSQCVNIRHKYLSHFIKESCIVILLILGFRPVDVAFFDFMHTYTHTNTHTLIHTHNGGLWGPHGEGPVLCSKTNPQKERGRRRRRRSCVRT